MASNGEPRRLQVAIPIFENMTMLDLVGPYEMLNAVPHIDVVFVGHKRGLVSDLGSFTMEAKASFDEVPSPDVLVVPGGLGTRTLQYDKTILDWIRKAHETTLYTTSVCTGSLLLGAAGLLKGLDATTHWAILPTLSSFGANPVSARVVRQGKIITAAGVSSGIDMGIQLVALLTDELTAKAVQLFTEYDPEPPFNTGHPSKATPDVRDKTDSILHLHHADFAAKTQGK
ncbi:hypothetical protein M758_10G108100 [Ceratodon purpureus]|nr:hypothetical protein M758_10G108100 [Ceratodon purpureus]